KKTGEMVDSVDEYLTSNYPYARRSLETSFLARCIEFLISNGTCSVVLPQNWLFLSGYKEFREVLLNTLEWNFVARLGAGAFETISGEHVKAILLTINKTAPILTESKSSTKTLFIDVSNEKSTGDKLMHLQTNNISFIPQFRQLQNPDQRIVMGEEITGNMLSDLASGVHGTNTKDSLRFIRNYWEVDINNKDWELGQTTADTVRDFGGLTTVYFWEKGAGELKWLADRGKAILAGGLAWGKRGISVRQVGHLPCTNYLGSKFDQNCAAIIPSVETNLAAIWCFCSTEEFNKSVREIDQSLKVTNSTLVKVAFDLDHWTQVAKEKYPIGLPEPYSDDPTQWIFHGHPCGSVVWDDTTKWTAQGPLRLDDTVLQVAVVCLLGYQWPAELDAEMELADEQREWVEKSKTLSCFVDDDGIVCLSAVRSEKPAHERIDQLLQAAYGSEWSTHVRNKLLEQVGYKNKSLELWLREKFFEQHCKLFQHRPFIWQLWDGLKDGFSVLVNYHKLDKKNLERLIYTYLDDWIRSQKLQQAEGIDGSTERLAAAEGLKQRLELILEGEAPYDIFVRWKPLAQQPIGWDPDLNDGVRLNIRPFMTVTDVGQKGAGILRAKPNIKWTKDRGKDVETAHWYKLGLEYDGKEGDRINDHHLSLAEKQAENP
ncbi:MAG: N-6 DNA methylase, partial [Chloroflexi bacterium]|nr:N-6 DNA methylase [Chloroflexota bacterium]